MRPLAITVFIAVLFAPKAAFTQNPDTLDTAFRTKLRMATDSLVKDQKKYVETLFTHGDGYSLSSAWSLRLKVDSALLAARDSLDETRGNNIRLMNREQERSMNDISAPPKKLVGALLTHFEKDIRAWYAAHQTCPTCRTSADYDSMFTLFGTQADSISGFYGDSMATVVESWETSIDDASGAFTESLDDTLETLKAEYADYLKNHATRLEIDAGYETHANYRGRDNGISEASFGPTVTYHHRSGLYLGGSLGWVSQSLSSPDVGSLSAGYEFSPSSVMQGSVSYTHFWYSSASPLPQAVTNQEVGGMLDLQMDPLSVEGTLLDDFTAGGGSEVSIDLGISTDIDVSDQVFGGTLKLTPTAEASWGQQSERFLQKRIVRAKKKEIVRVSGSPYDVFSIMSYGLSLPIDFEIGNFAIAPVIEWILPVDVLNQKTVLVKDPSSSSAFLSAGLSVSITFY